MTPSTKRYRDRTLALGLAVIGSAMGAWAAWVYARAGLTLSHYDARAHLVVARRVIDSLTPGWAQVGAVWLPLPHLLNVFPVQVDAFYRTGASAVVISSLAFALACYAAARLVLRATGSALGAATTVMVMALDPSLLYLQATPMTEPLLLGLTLLGLDSAYAWVERGAAGPPTRAGWALAAACLTRYEAWFVTVAVMAAAWFVLWRRGDTARRALRVVGRLAVYPGAAVAAFLVHSRITIGEWLVTGGFFVPDNPSLGRPWAAVGEVAWGVSRLAGPALAIAALAAAIAVLAVGLFSRRRPEILLTLSTIGLAVLPVYAFSQGHPFRIRYMAPMIASIAITAGTGIGLMRSWWRTAGGGLLAAVILSTAHPFDGTAPLVVEAQSDRANVLARQAVTACLARGYRGELILASMGSLAHYMQELSLEGFAIRNFVHEGNGSVWRNALDRPEGLVGWILIEEQSEGGDMLASRARTRPEFLLGFHRLCEGGGIALYEADRQPPPVD